MCARSCDETIQFTIPATARAGRGHRALAACSPQRHPTACRPPNRRPRKNRAPPCSTPRLLRARLRVHTARALSPSAAGQSPSRDPETQQAAPDWTPICTRLCGKQGRGPGDSRAPRTPGRRLLPGGESRGCPDSECQDGVPSGAAQVTQPRTEPLRGPRCRSGLRPGPGPAEAAGRWLPDLFSSAVTAATPAGGLRGAPPGTASATVVQSQLPRLRPEGHAAHARRRSERVQARRSATGRAHV